MSEVRARVVRSRRDHDRDAKNALPVNRGDLPRIGASGVSATMLSEPPRLAVGKNTLRR